MLGLVREKYSGAEGERFGPTLTTEHLESEDGVKVAVETLRQWMLAEGLWSRERKRRQHRKRRERKEHFGEMVQMDGSFHAWLEERGPRGCLIDLVDDATSTTWAQLGEQETIWAVADALRAWIERYGVPLALYVDWKNLYKRLATPGERLRGEEPITQFGRMCAKLGIELIAASSPQAKGRVERVHGTHQDRLVKKLRRKGIISHEAANVYLRSEYLTEHNRRFARAAARKEDYHRRTPRAAMARDRRAREAAGSRYAGPQRAPARADCRQETEVDAAGKPSVASSGPPRGAEASLQVGGHSIAPVVGQVLRCALTASPFGLRRAALRTRPTKPGMP